MTRLAGIDFGTVRIGLAISDERHLLARPLCFVYAGKSLQEAGGAIQRELSKLIPLKTVVLGLPLHLNGRESPLSLQVRELSTILEDLLSVPIVLWDERLTTVQVERSLKECGFNRKKRAERLDAESAAAILQNYLDSLCTLHE
jgi:putative holliday junction resolvase